MGSFINPNSQLISNFYTQQRKNFSKHKKFNLKNFSYVYTLKNIFFVQQISQVEIEDTGKYSCIVTNIAGSAESTYYVQVHGKLPPNFR